MSKFFRFTIAYLLAFIVLIVRLTCRYRALNDPRPHLRSIGKPYIMALLHAQQLNALFYNNEKRLTAMVSRSADGDFLVPLLKLRRVRPVRGSTRKNGQDKGGRAALAEIKTYLVKQIPALIAVDGPRGPRGYVNRGAVDLALETGAAILPIAIMSDRFWVLKNTWDLFEIPKPFSTITISFTQPFDPTADVSAMQEKVALDLKTLEENHLKRLRRVES